VTDQAAPYVLAAGQSRRDDAILPFKALANDTGGLLSACEFTLGLWESGRPPAAITNTARRSCSLMLAVSGVCQNTLSVDRFG
jgi:hypothetical protein